MLPKMKIFLPMYNVEKWISTTFNSLKNQTFQDYEAYFLDDSSSDNSVALLKNLIKDKNNFFINVNEQRKYTLQNLWDNIPKFSNNKNDIIVDLDGDDWLYNKDVLEKIYSAHKDGYLFTHGSYMHYPEGFIVSEGKYSEETKKNNSYRKDRWRCSGIRTFRRELWDNVTLKDVTEENGNFYKITSDLAFTFPLLEASQGKIKNFDINECFHVYNRINPLNDSKQNRELQIKTELKIRGISEQELIMINREGVQIKKL